MKLQASIKEEFTKREWEDENACFFVSEEKVVISILVSAWTIFNQQNIYY